MGPFQPGARNHVHVACVRPKTPEATMDGHYSIAVKACGGNIFLSLILLSSASSIWRSRYGGDGSKNGKKMAHPTKAYFVRWSA